MINQLLTRPYFYGGYLRGGGFDSPCFGFPSLTEPSGRSFFVAHLDPSTKRRYWPKDLKQFIHTDHVTIVYMDGWFFTMHLCKYMRKRILHEIFISLRLMPPAFAGLEIASSMARSTTKSSSSNNSTILSIASSMARSTTKSNSNSSNNQQQQ